MPVLARFFDGSSLHKVRRICVRAIEQYPLGRDEALSIAVRYPRLVLLYPHLFPAKAIDHAVEHLTCDALELVPRYIPLGKLFELSSQSRYMPLPCLLRLYMARPWTLTRDVAFQDQPVLMWNIPRREYRRLLRAINGPDAGEVLGHAEWLHNLQCLIDVSLAGAGTRGECIVDPILFELLYRMAAYEDYLPDWVQTKVDRCRQRLRDYLYEAWKRDDRYSVDTFLDLGPVLSPPAAAIFIYDLYSVECCQRGRGTVFADIALRAGKSACSWFIRLLPDKLQSQYPSRRSLMVGMLCRLLRRKDFAVVLSCSALQGALRAIIDHPDFSNCFARLIKSLRRCRKLAWLDNFARSLAVSSALREMPQK